MKHAESDPAVAKGTNSLATHCVTDVGLVAPNHAVPPKLEIAMTMMGVERNLKTVSPHVDGLIFQLAGDGVPVLIAQSKVQPPHQFDSLEPHIAEIGAFKICRERSRA